MVLLGAIYSWGSCGMRGRGVCAAGVWAKIFSLKTPFISQCEVHTLPTPMDPPNSTTA